MVALGGRPAAARSDAEYATALNAGALDVEPRPGHIRLPGVVKLAEISGSDTFVHAETAAGDVVAQLEKQELPDQLPPPEVTSVANPFE